MGRNQKIPSLHDLQQAPLLDQKGPGSSRQIPATHDLLSRHLESGFQGFGQFGVRLHFLLNAQYIFLLNLQQYSY
jgi:hypothetical protein